MQLKSNPYLAAEWKKDFPGLLNDVLLTLFWMGGYRGSKLVRQNEMNFGYDRLALTSIFGLCFMSVCLTLSAVGGGGV